MCRSNFRALSLACCLLFASLANARNISVGYFSWKEKLVIQQGPLIDQEQLQITGYQLHYERSFFHRNWGFSPGVGLLAGAATGGSIDGFVDHTVSRVSMLGALVLLKAEYRMNPQVFFSLAPGMLYRSVNLPKTEGIQIDQVSDFNFTVIFEQKLRFSPVWDLRFKLGAVTLNASAFWGLDLGHYF
jgi:hypothetical protein